MSTLLFIPTEGACAGHPCDNCKICQSGRCCRNDNPDYKLPEMGEWDGPIYGELGVLVDDGQRVECHCCGETYKGLGVHIWRKHDLTADEYRAIFGLGYNHSLNSADVRKRASEISKALVKSNPVVAANLAAAIMKRDAATAEQKQAWRSRRLDRLESRRNIATVFGKSRGHDGNGGLDAFRVQRGVPSPRAILDWPRVRDIRARHQSGESIGSLCDSFNMSRSAIRYIVQGKTWREDKAAA